MHIFIIAFAVLLLLFGPQWWVQTVMKRHNKPRSDFPGNGGEFARHLLNRLNLDQVQVETSANGDHYDPIAGAVRLSATNMNSRSLTAITVAAHEVGHALQHKIGYTPFVWRTRIAVAAVWAQQIGNGLILLAPLVGGLSRAPSSMVIMLVAGIASFGSAALLHLITLPVEWDASFRRALPLLEAGRYLHKQDQQGAKQILTAAAFTYVAGSLAGLLNIWRWLRWIRR